MSATPPESSATTNASAAKTVPAGRPSKQVRIAAALEAPWLRWVLRRSVWRGLLVLNYHRIGPADAGPWDRSMYSATQQAFDAQVALLAGHADVVGPDDLDPRGLRSRGRKVLLTFDDGYRDNFDLALPVLRAHGVPALFFPVTGFVDAGTTSWWDEIAWMLNRAAPGTPIGPGPGLPAGIARHDDDDGAAVTCALISTYKQLPGHMTDAYLDHLGDELGTGRCIGDHGHWMTWDMIREMRDAGMGFGGHTVHHPVLSQLPAEEQAAEIRGCARRLREELGAPMRWFSYPVGARDSFTAQTKATAAAEGIELAFSFYGGIGGPRVAGRFDVPRIHVGPHVTPQLLRATLGLPHLFGRAA